jgi:hypothetical protein
VEDDFQRIWFWLYLSQKISGMDSYGSISETVGQIIENIRFCTWHQIEMAVIG